MEGEKVSNNSQLYEICELLDTFSPSMLITWLISPFPFKNTVNELWNLTFELVGAKIALFTETELSLKYE